MIYTYKDLITNQTIRADVCIIGSGAGGSAAAHALTQSGLDVVLLERGSYLLPQDFNQHEEKMFPKLFYDSGGRRTSNRAIRILHGQGVGGTTLHNINLCKRLPHEIFDQWGLSNFSYSTFLLYLKQIEGLLNVSRILQDQLNTNNRLLRKGVQALGYHGDFLSHNRIGCVGSGFCELGCSYDAKQNAVKVLIPKAIQKGLRVYANVQAVSLHFSNRKTTHLNAEVINPLNHVAQAQIKIEAQAFISAAGAIETPLLLLRSELPDPANLIGSRLHLHPGVMVLGVFNEKVEAWKGIPQSYECTEFLSFTKPNQRVWIIAGSAHPAGAASLVPGFGKQHQQLMGQFPYLAALSVMIHDHTQGRVSQKDQFGACVDYLLNPDDRAQLAQGMIEASRILLSAGAQEVVLPFVQPIRIRSLKELNLLHLDVSDHKIEIVSVHQMSSVWMGNSAETSCADPHGRYYHLDNLFVSDTSLFPTSIGVPPQITAYACGLYVGDQVKAMI